MDQEKIGKFIADNRKKQKLTQEQLAEKLHVSKNAVSKWERGLNLPDVSLMEDLCQILKISLNELFAGEYLKSKDILEQSEKNILSILKFNADLKKKKWKIAIILAILLIVIINPVKCLLVKYGYAINDNLRHCQRYEPGKGNIKGEVNTYYYENINMDFEIGANKNGYAVFKNPERAYKRLKKDYAKGIMAIAREFRLLPLTNFNFRAYSNYGWQLTWGTDEEKEQAHFVSDFFEIYENSFNQVYNISGWQLI